MAYSFKPYDAGGVVPDRQHFAKSTSWGPARPRQQPQDNASHPRAPGIVACYTKGLDTAAVLPHRQRSYSHANHPMFHVSSPIIARVTLLTTVTQLFAILASPALLFANDLEPLKYQHGASQVDLGVGLWAWPLPMVFDNDGDWDLVVSCPDKPYNGTYVFENPATPDELFPVFKPPRRISRGLRNVQVSWVNGRPVVMTPDAIYPKF